MSDPNRWTEQLAGLKARQAEAAQKGRKAEEEGRPVIYIHGRPYEAPEEPDEAFTESPFPWDLWDE